MDINQQLQPVITGMLNELKTSIGAELRQQITNEVVKNLATTELNTIINDQVQKQIQRRLDTFNFASAGEQELQLAVRKLTDQLTKSIGASANHQIESFVKDQLSQIDIKSAVNGVVKSVLGSSLQTNFPDGSIPCSSINFSGMTLTGDNINGGIISNFGSTGIEDRASHIQITLMDHATAFEGPVWAPSAVIKGDVSIDGRLVINGEIATDTNGFIKLVNQTSEAVKTLLNDDLFSGFSNIIFDKIRTEGIELDKITQDGKLIVSGNQLGYHIVDSNIRRLGVVNDLQTSGENLLSDTLYVSSRRVGINTIDPTASLSVWDQEVEVTISKQAQDVGMISTPRHQMLVLGSNGKENIRLDPEGNAQVDKLILGTIPMSSATTLPNYPGQAGQVVWNSVPNHGTFIGWVCLGKTLWAGFGRIE